VKKKRETAEKKFDKELRGCYIYTHPLT